MYARPIWFTQYLLPDGRQRRTATWVPFSTAANAERLTDAGYRLECEVLTTGAVSFTIHDPKKEEDVAIEICDNGAEVPGTVVRLIDQNVERLLAENGA